MTKINSFVPLIANEPPPQVLILGSMPSVISLNQQAYYANPRNAFWQIMAKLLGFDDALPYTKKMKEITQAQIALWDVYRSCVRQGSLDSAIRNAQPNDIEGLLNTNNFRAIFLNGSTATKGFERAVDKQQYKNLAVYSLPSTSPANARMNFNAKYLSWKKAWQNTFS